MDSRWCFQTYEDRYFGLTGELVDDKIGEQARENRYSMRGFERLREWELWRFCQGLDEDVSLGIPALEGGLVGIGQKGT